MSSSEKISPKNLLQIPLWRILKLIRQSSSGWTALHLFLIVVRGVLPLVQLYLIKLIIDEVTAGIGSQDKTAAIGKVVVVIIIAGIVYLIGAMLDSAASYVKQAHTMAVTDHLHDLIHRKSIEVDLAYYEDSKYFDNLHRAQQEAYFRPQYLMNSLQEIFQSARQFMFCQSPLFFRRNSPSVHRYVGRIRNYHIEAGRSPKIPEFPQIPFLYSHSVGQIIENDIPFGHIQKLRLELNTLNSLDPVNCRKDYGDYPATGPQVYNLFRRRGATKIA